MIIITNYQRYIFLYIVSVGCRAIGKLAGIEGTDVYCLRNCFHNGAKNCPKDECECYGADDENEVSISTTYLDEGHLQKA